jgi:hypothetical protein
LHGVRGEFPDDVSGAAVGSIFTGHESEHKWATEWDAALYRGGVSVGGVCSVQQQPIRFKGLPLVKVCLRSLMTSNDGTHSGSRNVIRKLTLHTMQNP